MKSRFVAIGVAQGDAFFLERRGGFTALVDGGRSVRGFPAEFQRATKQCSVDVIVCTHNDADHANGVIGFLEAGLHCNEVWLPASWTDRLNDLFHPEQFTRELIVNVIGLSEAEIENLDSRHGTTLLEQVADRYERDQLRGNTEAVDAATLIESTLESSDEQQVGLSHDPLLSWHHDWPFLAHPLWGRDRHFQLLIEAIAAGDRIRQITQLAFHRGCRIRWFQYSSFDASGGNPGVLSPVNAREVLKVTVNTTSALMYLALSVTNRQSLVFVSPRRRGAPGILFTADSDLAFSNEVPWSDGMIVTTPHHGSEANGGAYRRFRREMLNPTSTTWVRSDGKFLSRPGASFLGLRASDVPVFCTLCRRASQPKQDLVFERARGHWKPTSTRTCACSQA